MAEIKSAFEMAMERFKDVEPDRGSIEKQDYLNKGKQLCAKKLQGESVDIAQEIQSTPDEFRELVHTGVGKSLLAQIALPTTDFELGQVSLLQDIAKTISSHHEDISTLFAQFTQVSKQYMEEKAKIVEQIQAQYMQMVQKQGRVDPNMMSSMQEQIKDFDQEYIPAVDEVKQVLSKLCNIKEEE